MKKISIIVLASLLSLAVMAREEQDSVALGKAQTSEDCVVEEADIMEKSNICVTPLIGTDYSDSSADGYGFGMRTEMSRGHGMRGGNRWGRFGAHWAGVMVSYNGLVENLFSMRLPDAYSDMRLSSKSIGVDINFIDFVIVSHNSFGLFTGLGMEINNFRFDNNITISRNSQGIAAIDHSFDDAGITLRKSKLTTGYINVPMMVEFKLGKGYRPKGFINFGAIGGLRFSSHTKIVRSENGRRIIDKNHRGLNLRNFHYGFGINAGYKHFALGVKYYPHSVFTGGGGPKVQQVNIGIGILF